MKHILLAVIVFISIAAFYGVIPSTSLIESYGLLAIAPIILIYIKRNLLNVLLLIIIIVAFKLPYVTMSLLPAIAPYRVLLLIVSVFYFTDLVMHKRKILGSFKAEIAMLLLCIYILFSMMFAGSGYEEGHGIFLAYLISAYLIPFSVFFLMKNLVSDEREIRKIFISFAVMGLYLGLTGIFEHFLLKSLVYPKYIMNPSVGIDWGRARGPFVQSGMYGMVISMIFFISYYLLTLEKRKWARFLLVITLFSILIALFFTYNRGAWIEILLSSLFVARFISSVRKPLIALALVLIFVVGVLASLNSLHLKKVEENQASFNRLSAGEAVSERLTAKGSIYNRINIYITAGRMFLAKPIFGFGYNMFKKEQDKYFRPVEWIPFTLDKGLSMHNMYVMVLVEYGLVGLSLFLYILFYIINITRKLYRQLPQEGFLSKDFIIMSGGIIIVYLTAMLAQDLQYDIFPNALFYCIAGILDGVYQRNRLNASHKEIMPSAVIAR